MLTLAPMQEPVRIPMPDGGWLAGDLSFAQEVGDWAVVWVHGFGSVRGGEKSQALEAACSRRNWTFAAFDFRGHGQSSGTMLELTGSSLLADLHAVREYLGSRGVSRIGFVGSSMGGWASAWAALQAGPDAVPACVLLAPALQFMQNRWASLSPEQRELWRTTGKLAIQSEWNRIEVGYALAEERTRYPVGDLAAKWDRPLLIVHGMQDSIIPYATSVAFAEQTACPDVQLRLLKSGDHRLNSHKHAIAEEACEFLDRVTRS